MNLEQMAKKCRYYLKRRDRIARQLTGFRRKITELKAKIRELSPANCVAEMHWMKEEVKAYYALKSRLAELKQEHDERDRDFSKRVVVAAHAQTMDLRAMHKQALAKNKKLSAQVKEIEEMQPVWALGFNEQLPPADDPIYKLRLSVGLFS